MLQMYNSIRYLQAGEVKLKETLQSVCLKVVHPKQQKKWIQFFISLLGWFILKPPLLKPVS